MMEAILITLGILSVIQIILLLAIIQKGSEMSQLEEWKDEVNVKKDATGNYQVNIKNDVFDRYKSLEIKPEFEGFELKTDEKYTNTPYKFQLNGVECEKKPVLKGNWKVTK